jgi:hypothetical protein
MNLLLDTHTLIWALEDNSALTTAAREAIIDGNNVRQRLEWLRYFLQVRALPAR